MKPQRYFQSLFAILVFISFFLYRCTNEDEEPDLKYIPGDAVIDTKGEIWRFDKAHSNIEWETAYLGELALLTGRFSDFHIDVDFDEQHPESSAIFAYVVITSNLTGEPNRDGLGRCLPTTLGVIHNGDTLSDGSLDPEGIDSLSNVASFESVSITRDGADYHALGLLNFKGVSNQVDLVFNFLGIYDNSEAQDESDLRGAFSGVFTFPAKSVYGVESNNIGDDVTVRVNCHVRLR